MYAYDADQPINNRPLRASTPARTLGVLVRFKFSLFFSERTQAHAGKEILSTCLEHLADARRERADVVTWAKELLAIALVQTYIQSAATAM
jgi:hypothetical protein